MVKDKQTFEKARDMFINDKYSCDKISKQIDVSMEQVKRWARKFKWRDERKKKMEEEARLAMEAAVVYDLKMMLLDLRDVVNLIKEKIPAAEPGTIAELAEALDKLINTATNIQSLDRMEEEVKKDEPLRIAK